MLKIGHLFFYLLFSFFLACSQSSFNSTKSTFDKPNSSDRIPAILALAPIKGVFTNVELPNYGEKNISNKIRNDIQNKTHKYLTYYSAFQKVLRIGNDDLPSSPSTFDVSQAGREAGADLVLLVNILDFEGNLKYGFKPSISEKISIEMVIYETSTGVRVWNQKEEVTSNKGLQITNMTDSEIENAYVQLASEVVFQNILEELIPTMHSDMAEYKPPSTEKQVVGSSAIITDVDRVPRVLIPKRETSFAIVIGIETYRDLSMAEFAVKDAKIMKEYLIRVMGFPEENIVTLLNGRATKADIEGYLGTWLKNNIENDSIIFVYYAGHGAPDPATGEGFIIPFDGNPAFPEATSIPLKQVYDTISAYKAKQSIVVMDACFSGAGGRSVMAKGGRPVAISMENPVLSSNRLIAMTASSGTEISNSYPEKRHGLFTYFFLKGIQGEADINSDGNITLREVYSYVTPQVKKVARSQNKEQTPTMLPKLDELSYQADFVICRAN